MAKFSIHMLHANNQIHILHVKLICIFHIFHSQLHANSIGQIKDTFITNTYIYTKLFSSTYY